MKIIRGNCFHVSRVVSILNIEFPAEYPVSVQELFQGINHGLVTRYRVVLGAIVTGNDKLSFPTLAH